MGLVSLLLVHCLSKAKNPSLFLLNKNRKNGTIGMIEVCEMEEKEEVVSEETKVIDNLEDISSEEVIPEQPEEEVSEPPEDVSEQLEEEVSKETEEVVEDVPKKKKSKKWIIIIGIVLFLFILLAVFLLFFFVIRPKDQKSETKVMSDEEIIKDYGKQLEKVIADYKKEEGALLEYEEANTVLGYPYNIKCSVHEIYLDATIYLNKCKIDQRKVTFSYGKKQEEKEEEDNSEEASSDLEEVSVYVSKSTGKAILDEPKNQSDYQEYKIHLEKGFTNIELLSETSDFVVYSIRNNNDVEIKIHNYKKDQKAFLDEKYVVTIPIRYEGKYDDEYAVVAIRETHSSNGHEYYTDSYGINNLKTGEEAVPCIYNRITSSYGTAFFYRAAGDGYIDVVKEGKHGILNYRTNEFSVPLKYETLQQSDTYLYGKEKYGDTYYKVFDAKGNYYLEDQQVAEILSGGYAIVEDSIETSSEDETKPQQTTAPNPSPLNRNVVLRLVTIEGEELYNFGNRFISHYYNHAKVIRNSIVFQIEYVDAPNHSQCVHLEYSISAKKGYVDPVNRCEYNVELLHES